MMVEMNPIEKNQIQDEAIAPAVTYCESEIPGPNKSVSQKSDDTDSCLEPMLDADTSSSDNGENVHLLLNKVTSNGDGVDPIDSKEFEMLLDTFKAALISVSNSARASACIYISSSNIGLMVDEFAPYSTSGST